MKIQSSLSKIQKILSFAKEEEKELSPEKGKGILLL